MDGDTISEAAMSANSSDMTVFPFDYSVENHFNAMNMIRKLCGTEDGEETFDQFERERLNSRITFLREWKHYYYKPRTIQFSCEVEGKQGKDVIGEVNLPQFSAANVPKMKKLPSDSRSAESSDFILYVGGHVWALDWCPEVHWPDCHTKCEYLAVAAHPPESSYHKIGAPLTGRGVIQIWCVIHPVKEEESPAVLNIQRKTKKKDAEDKIENSLKRPRGRPRKDSLDGAEGERQMVHASICHSSSGKEKNPVPSKKGRGRPRKDSLDGAEGERQMVQASIAHSSSGKEKKPVPSKKGRGRRSKTRKDIVDTLLDSESEMASVPALVETPQEVCDIPSLEEVTRSIWEPSLPENCDKGYVDTEPLHQWIPKRPQKKRKMKDMTKEGSFTDGNSPVVQNQDENRGFVDVLHEKKNYIKDALNPSRNVANIGSLAASTDRFDPLNEIGFPRVVLCLAHNGKVAWDVKWRPFSATDVEHKNRMGYVAVMLGNGSLEVWEVPTPRAVEILYSSCRKEGTDPRFVKLEPVFRCSKLKSGKRHSIPLTVEWSSSLPYDLLLAGCHDGTVALWKFSADGSSQDTRPLLCFSADTQPIRALAWAPDESDEESANIIVTAGHGGVRFWDLRDPYHPLCDVNPVRRFIYSLDWLKDPRCVIMSFDDGTVRLLSLSKASNDLPVTGKSFGGKQQQGFHSYFCSSFPIWSVQASKLTGQVVYCSADGSVAHFQLTSNAVDKDSSRYRAPHYLCGSLTEEDATLSVNTPLANTPLEMKKPLKALGDTQSIGGLLSDISKTGKTFHQTSGGDGDERLALCYGDEALDALPVSKAKSAAKSNKKEKCEPVPVENQEETQSEIEVLPPKIVSMHRVRWNMNKGSERWVCYGGAAGIVRCQEVSLLAIGARASKIEKVSPLPHSSGSV